ncbi:MAG: beta-propeller domain-containing protein, partial [Ruminococcus sp.]|nr:beta-propeller domain-containing protein [Ruminococcus sp.]
VNTWRDSLWDQITGETGRDINNHLYVLDMSLNQVGHITDFGIDETVKSVSFSGDMAYVVTYRQTDPLYSIDLSAPAQPVILDELKILGYSSYMQNWSDGLLVGFGPDADENGRENGVKLVMFDNSDPDNLNEVGIYSVNYNDDEWLYSIAVWERKALLIAPEKNLVGFPVDMEYYENDTWYDESKYMFFSYDNGEFTLKGELSTGQSTEYGKGNLNRALYIGDYVYALSANKFISADIETMTVKDTLEF